ncbi:MAG: hypothetical protein EAZ70_05970 [Runella slithyformis]|nr:MAG: hypothetical protein EAY79_05420 [Runella slithyformis]TAF97976.1 MAG: hypothetical protein EAZ46_01180 [Runella sp.]TAG22986.1 MAG: hypothetical protein EAZ38_04290 [Cytophagales bacterium]TAG42040.1 MAG: hypothetical protein EAZ32_01815 [Cytophagia bacterium]TAF28177.1 MAG: hypothetical protein EAZ70_05970 [Runella slithyformis]
MKKNPHLKVAFILLISFLMGCADKTPKSVVLDRNYFVGSWELYSPVSPAVNIGLGITFLEDNTIQQPVFVSSKVPLIRPQWFFDAAQRQIIMANDNKKYYIVEYSQNQFVWQERADKYEGAYQRFNRK